MTSESIRILSHQQWLKHPYSIDKVEELKKSYEVGTANLIAYCCSSAKTELDIRVLGARLQAIKTLLDGLTSTPEELSKPQQ